jgi:alpha-tubulin suppressor-like RCC1 family protein
MGDNIKGQLGDNSIRFGKEFKPMNCFENTIVDVACGFQHTILVTGTYCNKT